MGLEPRAQGVKRRVGTEVVSGGDGELTVEVEVEDPRNRGGEALPLVNKFNKIEGGRGRGEIADKDEVGHGTAHMRGGELPFDPRADGLLERRGREGGSAVALDAYGKEYDVMIERLVLQGSNQTETAIEIRVELEGAVKKRLVVFLATDFDPFRGIGRGKNDGAAGGFSAVKGFEGTEKGKGDEGEDKAHGEHQPSGAYVLWEKLEGEDGGETKGDGEAEPEGAKHPAQVRGFNGRLRLLERRVGTHGFPPASTRDAGPVTGRQRARHTAG